MKIITTTYRRAEYGDLEDYGLATELSTNLGGMRISFGNGEPEDMTLGRDLSDAYSIQDMLKLAYEAGKNGEELIIEELTEDEE